MSLLFLNYLLILKFLLVTRSKDPKAAILTLKMLTGSRTWFCKIPPEVDCDKLTLAHFPCSQWEVGIRERQPISKKGILRRVSVSNCGSTGSVSRTLDKSVAAGIFSNKKLSSLHRVFIYLSVIIKGSWQESRLILSEKTQSYWWRFLINHLHI